MGKIIALIANGLWVFGCLKETLLLHRWRNRVQDIQTQVLMGIVRRNQQTVFGKEHRFIDIHSVADFQKNTLLSSYDDYNGYMEQIAQGELGVLTAERVSIFEPTSGSTAASKFIPYTRRLKKDFQKGIDPWIFHLFMWKPQLFLGRAYWSITPVGYRQKKTTSGIPIGFEEDSEYLGAVKKHLLDRILAVPREISHIKDITAFRYMTLFFLLSCKNLSLISVWNPTFLNLLLEPLQEWLPDLINDIANGYITSAINIELKIKENLEHKLSKSEKRSLEIKKVSECWQDKSPLERNGHGRTLYEALWPQLIVISCWADGNASEYAGQLQKAFPNVKIQPKGLIATEGFISFPLGGQEGNVLSLKSHFFEFIEHTNFGTTVRLAHELERGKHYSLVLTTSGGLYRYQLHDTVEVVGFFGKCPRIRFIGKEDMVVDLFGEKLNEYHVRSVAKDVFTKYAFHPSFWMVAPEKLTNGGGCCYTLFVETNSSFLGTPETLKTITQEIEEGLRENFHYDYCRRLNQLAPLKVFWIAHCKPHALETYFTVCSMLGQRAGDIKPITLHPYQGWSKKFSGSFVK